MIIDSEFKPARGLKNPDMQTLFPTLARLRVQLETRRERIELDDGDFLDLEWVGRGEGPIVIMLHGMAGNADSPYIKGLMQEIDDRGWRGVMMYYRGCSDQANRLPVTYHFGRTEDFAIVLTHIQQQHPCTPLYAVGFSMGGNILLKWLGENQTQQIIRAAVAVSTPYDLRRSSVNIRQGKGRLYQWLLMRDLRRYLAKKYNYANAPIDLKKMKKIKSFWDLDEKITAPLNGFKNAVDYYHSTSCKPWLKEIMTDTLIIHALDDPMVPKHSLPNETELSKKITLEISPHGGHVGFVSGSLTQPIFWTDHRIMDYLTKQQQTTITKEKT